MTPIWGSFIAKPQPKVLADQHHKGAFCHDLADPLNSMFKIADPFSASATFLYRPEHFLAVSFFFEIYTPHRKKISVEILWNKHLTSILTAKY